MDEQNLKWQDVHPPLLREFIAKFAMDIITPKSYLAVKEWIDEHVCTEQEKADFTRELLFWHICMHAQ